jgi:uncharacterized membrane protein YbhN (UPF0104 family)
LSESAAPALQPGLPKSRGRRFVKIGAWVAGIAIFLLICQLLGFDIKGWIEALWDQMTAIPAGYLVAALIFQTGQTVFAGVSYYGILGAAYPGEVTMRPIVAAYAVGVAGNSFLPANLGTLVTLLMFVAIIPSASFSGSVAAYLVQKIFYTVVGAFVYLYLFFSVPGSFDLSFGREHTHPAFFFGIVAGGIFLIVVVVRIFWRQVKKLWAQAKKGGAILAKPKQYLKRVVWPEAISYACKMVVIGIFLAAFAIPVTFDSIMWVIGSGSLANVASFTPGAIGVTQATNALALKTCCQVPNSTAIAYSTSQQLITSAWNVIFALIAVVWVFGWTGGKELVGSAYTDAKAKATEMKEDRKRKREEKNAGTAAGENEPSPEGGE